MLPDEILMLEEQLRKQREAEALGIPPDQLSAYEQTHAPVAAAQPATQQVTVPQLPNQGIPQLLGSAIGQGINAVVPAQQPVQAAPEQPVPVDPQEAQLQQALPLPQDIARPEPEELTVGRSGIAHRQQAAAGQAEVATQKGLMGAEGDLEIAARAVSDADTAARQSAQNFETARAARTSINDALMQVVNAKAKDPWADKTTGQKIAGLAAAFLGGLLLPTLGRNPGMEMINKIIDREMQAESETRNRQLQALQMQQGIASDEATDSEKELNRQMLFRAAKLQAFKQQIDAMITKNTLPPEMQNQYLDIFGQLEGQYSELLGRVGKDAFDKYIKQLTLEAKAAKAAGGPAQQKPVSSEANYYDAATGQVFNFNSLDEKQQKDARSELTNVRIVNRATGQEVRGIRGLRDKQAEAIEEALGNYEKVRTSAQRLLTLLNKTDASDRVSFMGAFSSGEGAAALSEFTQLMVALKDQWEFGAIQAPDMKLLEGAAGQGPEKLASFFASLVDKNQMVPLLQNLQSGAEIRVTNNIKSRLGLSDEWDITASKANVTSDIDERGTPDKPDTDQELANKFAAAVSTPAEKYSGGLNEKENDQITLKKQIMARVQGLLSGKPGASKGNTEAKVNEIIQQLEANLSDKARRERVGNKDETIIIQTADELKKMLEAWQAETNWNIAAGRAKKQSEQTKNRFSEQELPSGELPATGLE